MVRRMNSAKIKVELTKLSPDPRFYRNFCSLNDVLNKQQLMSYRLNKNYNEKNGSETLLRSE